MLQNISGQTIYVAFSRYVADKSDPKHVRPSVVREEICINAGDYVDAGEQLDKLKTHNLWAKMAADPKIFKQIG